MDSIQHKTLELNGINIHVAETAGHGPVILFLHGFPECWYSWRHQILALSQLGYRCLAPDLRGFGDTDAPVGFDKYTVFHLVGDMVALLDAVAPAQSVFVVGHDWGAFVAWHLSLLRPDKVRAMVNLSVPFMPRNPIGKPADLIKLVYGDDHYISRFQDIETYASKFEKNGFTGGFNYYRALNLNWELTAPWTGAQVKVPSKFITGDLDIVYNTFDTKKYVNGKAFKQDVPNLQEVVVLQGVAHWIQQEKPDETTKHIADFIANF